MSGGQTAASCTLTLDGAVSDVLVGKQLAVTYTFNTSASGAATLQIPYAVEINGTVLPEFADKPRCLGENRKIKLKVAPGTNVALYLNSDSHPAYRTQAVYAVQARERDVEVTITERMGRSNTETTKLRAPTCIQTADGKRFDKYEAALTGDIWMKISHRYTCEEAADIIASETDPIIRSAVLSIFSTLKNNTPIINFAASTTSPAQILSLTFEEQQSVSANTSYCPLLSHVLPNPPKLRIDVAISKPSASSTCAVSCEPSLAWRCWVGV